MGSRKIILSNPARLQIRNNNLQISQEGNTYSIPTEDISSLVIENQQVILSNAVLFNLASMGACVISCDDKHKPVSINTPFQSHCKQRKRMDQQLSLTEPFKKRLWQKVIKQKIINQIRCLAYLNFNMNLINLDKYVDMVKSGDPRNIEAVVSKRYFLHIWGIDFNRREDNSINAALNYGYAIIRSTISNNLAAYGFIPSFGIHHHSELNNFNLSDDFIEPFRPVVDLWVARNLELKNDFGKEHRQALVNLLNDRILINDEYRTISNAIEKMVISLVISINQKDYSKIKLPTLLNIK